MTTERRRPRSRISATAPAAPIPTQAIHRHALGALDEQEPVVRRERRERSERDHAADVGAHAAALIRRLARVAAAAPKQPATSNATGPSGLNALTR